MFSLSLASHFMWMLDYFIFQYWCKSESSQYRPMLANSDPGGWVKTFRMKYLLYNILERFFRRQNEKKIQYLRPPLKIFSKLPAFHSGPVWAWEVVFHIVQRTTKNIIIHMLHFFTSELKVVKNLKVSYENSYVWHTYLKAAYQSVKKKRIRLLREHVKKKNFHS